MKSWPHEILYGVLLVCMRVVRTLFRERGSCGTPARPLYFAQGDPVPWWIVLQMPFGVRWRFTHDVESYYERGSQVVRPQLGVASRVLIEAEQSDSALLSVFVGAPTVVVRDSRKRPSASAAFGDLASVL